MNDHNHLFSPTNVCCKQYLFERSSHLHIDQTNIIDGVLLETTSKKSELHTKTVEYSILLTLLFNSFTHLSHEW